MVSLTAELLAPPQLRPPQLPQGRTLADVDGVEPAGELCRHLIQRCWRERPLGATLLEAVELLGDRGDGLGRHGVACVFLEGHRKEMGDLGVGTSEGAPLGPRSTTPCVNRRASGAVGVGRVGCER
eukprot:scaffold48536_cov65-Phaeocystis_antarctica.AAC.1